MKYKMKLVALLLSMLLLACATTSGTKFRWDNVRELKVGMTEQEVVGRLGPPKSYTAQQTAEGFQEIYIWVVAYDSTSYSASVIFLDGKAISVPTIPDSYKDKK